MRLDKPADAGWRGKMRLAWITPKVQLFSYEKVASSILCTTCRDSLDWFWWNKLMPGRPEAFRPSNTPMKMLVAPLRWRSCRNSFQPLAFFLASGPKAQDLAVSVFLDPRGRINDFGRHTVPAQTEMNAADGITLLWRSFQPGVDVLHRVWVMLLMVSPFFGFWVNPRVPCHLLFLE